MPLAVLNDLRTHKMPALERAKAIKPPGRDPRIVLFTRSGFTDALRAAAGGDVELVDAETLAAALSPADAQPADD